ncbi:MAG: hypothetical protein EOP83_05460 [Verrucomicrobiaceae bacterium]|nr:MAG: hypothetical protein EOP83_05460 [Verrucomicrobiaceae bacterium]
MRSRRSAKARRVFGTVLRLDQHRHLLRFHNYEFGIDVVEWIEETGIGAYEVRAEMEDMENAPGYVRAIPVVVFASTDDAFAFKMRWL